MKFDSYSSLLTRVDYLNYKKTNKFEAGWFEAVKIVQWSYRIISTNHIVNENAAALGALKCKMETC